MVWNNIRLAFLLLATAMLTSEALAQEEEVRRINCANRSLQAVINRASGPTIIEFSGTCTETITISKDDITLDGDSDDNCGPLGVGSDGTIDGTVTVDASKRVTFHCVRVQGGQGILATNGSSVTVENSDLSDNDEFGIQVSNASTATINSTLMERNGATNPTPNNGIGCGAEVISASHATITNSTVRDNTICGLAAVRSSTMNLMGNTVEDNATGGDCGIDSNLESAVALRGGNVITGGVGAFAPVCLERYSSVRSGSFTVDGDPLTGETADIIDADGADLALFGGELGYVDFRNTVVTGNVEIAVMSLLRVQSSTITGDLNVSEDSRFRFRNAGAVPALLKSGTLTCDASSGIYFSSAIPCNVTCDADGVCSPLP